MTYTVPNTFAAENGQQPAAQLDACFAACLLGINNVFLKGTLAARPAPDGVGNGRYYLATDTLTLYYDDGASWIQAGASGGAVASGTYKTVGLIGAPNVATPLTKYDLISADAVVVRDPSTGGTRTFVGQGSLTADISIAGPTAGGRDQAGAFAASSWLYLYYIAQAAGILSTVWSLTPPPMGPTLPAGYLLAGLAACIRLTGASQLVPTLIRGDFASIVPVTVRPYAVGTGGEQTYDISANVPPNHTGVELALISNIGSLQAEVRVASGGQVALSTQDSSNSIAVSHQGRVPLAGQSVFYFGNAGLASAVRLGGYWMPN